MNYILFLLNIKKHNTDYNEISEQERSSILSFSMYKTFFQSNLFPRRPVLILFSVKNITIDKMRINGKRNTQMSSCNTTKA